MTDNNLQKLPEDHTILADLQQELKKGQWVQRAKFFGVLLVLGTILYGIVIFASQF